MRPVVAPPPVPQGVEECWAALDAGRIRYLHAGSGPPLLLIHGLLGYSFSWRHNLRALADHATVYAPDLLGTGFSERPRGLDCSMRAIALRQLQFLEQLNISSCDVLGTSHGGAIAMMLAALAAERGSSQVQRLILVDPVNPWSSVRRFLIPVLASRPGAAAFRVMAPRAPLLRSYVLRRLYGDVRRIAPGTLEGYAAPLTLAEPFKYGLSVVRSWYKDVAELRSLLPRIASIPTLLLWGSRDLAVLPSSAPHLRDQFRHCELVIFDGVGHLPYEEAPEKFNQAVIRFLAKGRTAPISQN